MDPHLPNKGDTTKKYCGKCNLLWSQHSQQNYYTFSLRNYKLLLTMLKDVKRANSTKSNLMVKLNKPERRASKIFSLSLMRWRTQQNITTCSIIYDYVPGKPPVFQVTGFNCWNEILGLKYPTWQNSILLWQARSKPQYTCWKKIVSIHWVERITVFCKHITCIIFHTRILRVLCTRHEEYHTEIYEAALLRVLY